ncbi:MAG: cobalamin-binding protein [Thermodesulfovibrionales bacterium]|nr:cobalamin-binding protein [Thermodesulfovibrionales bacterium]
MKVFGLIFSFILFLSGAAYAMPDRIVSLAPNITEILFALKLEKKIVGVTDYCDYPPDAKKKKSVGGMTTPSFEAIVMLKPDLVVLAEDGNQKLFEEKLRKKGIKTYVFRAKQLIDLPQEILNLGKIVGAEKPAHDLAYSINKVIEEIKAKKSLSSNKRALFIIWPSPLLVAGPNTAIDDALTLLGLKNIAANAKSRYPQYSIEEVIRSNPEIIFVGKGHTQMESLSKKLLDKLYRVDAVKNNRVYFVSDSLYRVGPRIVDGLRELSQYVR